MTISRMQQPRQMYGLGSLVKSIGKGVKSAVKGVVDVAKSPLGLAALTAGGFGLAGMGPLKGLGSTSLGNFLFGGGTKFLPGATAAMKGAAITQPGIFGRAIDAFQGMGNIGKAATLFGVGALGGGALQALEAAGVEDPEAQIRDVDALEGYLRQGYMELNPNASSAEVEEFVQANTREYRSMGGRIGFRDGTKFLSFEEAKAMNPGMFMDTTTSAYGDAGEGRPVPRYFEDKMQTLNEAKEGMSPRGRIAIFKQYLDEALATGQISKEKYQEMLMPLFGQQGEIITEQIKEYENFANGGRIGYAFGDVVDQASGIMGLPQRTNQAGVKELDLRDSGGFIPPVGVKEKADDIPAMLSNNEFVFTADAVRGMGDGDVNKGAQRMYDMMKKLENGGRV